MLAAANFAALLPPCPSQTIYIIACANGSIGIRKGFDTPARTP